ncbi:MAG: tetratricopeptide repeat protein [Flavobacteriales bacterium]
MIGTHALRLTSASLLLVAGLALQAQNGKSFLKEGDQFRKEQQLDKALERYGLAIEVDPGMTKAYQARAEVLVLLGRDQEAIADLQRLAELEPKDSDAASAVAAAYFRAGQLEAARSWCDKALERDERQLDALQTRVRACLALGDLDCATASSDKALATKATTDTYYLHGLARMAARDLTTAEKDFQQVIDWNHVYEEAYIALAEVQLKLYEGYEGPTMKMRTLDKAVEETSTALELNPQSIPALKTRSRAHAFQQDHAKAIADISRVVALGDTDTEVYRMRAGYYQGFGQYQNAINDLNRVLAESPEDRTALVQRSACREANLDLDGALDDLKLATKLAEKDPDADLEEKRSLAEARDRIGARVFELGREADPPRITVLEPFRKEGDVVQVSSSLNYVKVSGYVRDKSLLKAITVNGEAADFNVDEKDPQFIVSVPLAHDQEELAVQAVDVYDNFSNMDLRVERTEGLAPSIVLTSPEPSGDREITIEEGKEDVFVEGLVSDASPIRLIAVDGVNASYAPDRLDPDFSIKVPVAGKDRFVVRAEDQHGNAAEAVFTIRRIKPAPVAVATPTPTTTTPTTGTTGTTWIVHIDNSNYKGFPAITGKDDAAKMRQAFGNYRVQRTITKKDMTKADLDRFFNIELRDLVRTNQVNTILVWYSGHGRNVSGKAYWVPVDAKKDDVYSYFNYGSLKAQMQNYSETVGNTVVVSDAAGSEASFYELTR